METLKKIFAAIVLVAVGIFVYFDEYSPQVYAVAANRTGANDMAKFEVDGKAYEFNGIVDRFLLLKDVGVGKHTVTYNGETFEFEVGRSDGESILNLDRVAFLKGDIIYAEDEASFNAELAKLPKNRVTALGKTYEGPFTRLEPAIYLKKDWFYSPIHPEPEKVKLRFWQSSAVRSKLFFLEDGFRREFEPFQVQ